MPDSLTLSGVRKSFGGVRAADGIDLEIGPQDLLCVVGPNGCGKTTLFNLVTGLLRPDDGAIRFGTADLTRLAPTAIAALGVGRKFQVPSVFDELSVADNLRVAAVSPAALAATDGTRAALAAAATHKSGGSTEDLLATVGLAERAADPAEALSHGEKQWLEIAMVLACRPRLLLLDEPTAGMTRAETLATAELVKRLHAAGGVAVVLIEHDMHFVAALDCPVAVMIRGRLVARGSFQEVGRLPEVREAYLGGSADAVL